MKVMQQGASPKRKSLHDVSNHLHHGYLPQLKWHNEFEGKGYEILINNLQK